MSFRQLVNEVERQFRFQGRRGAEQDTAGIAGEDGVPAIAGAVTAQPEEAAGMAASLAVADQARNENQPAEEFPLWLKERLAQLEESQAQPEGEPEGSATGSAEAAVSMASAPESAANEEQEVTSEEPPSGKPSRLNDAEAMLFPMELNEVPRRSDPASQSGEETAPSAPDGVPARKPSRLSGLRGVVSEESLRELSELKRPIQQPIEFPPPAERAEGGEGMVRPGAECAPAEAAQQPNPARVEAFVPRPKSEPAPNDGAASEANRDEPQKAEGKPEAMPPQSVNSRSDRRESFDDVQILPSRRGQYRKKG